MHVEPIQEKVEGENFRCYVLSSLKGKLLCAHHLKDVLSYCKISGATYIKVNVTTIASQNGFSTDKLSLPNNIQKMSKKLFFITLKGLSHEIDFDNIAKN